MESTSNVVEQSSMRDAINNLQNFIIADYDDEWEDDEPESETLTQP